MVFDLAFLTFSVEFVDFILEIRFFISELLDLFVGVIDGSFFGFQFFEESLVVSFCLLEDVFQLGVGGFELSGFFF